jgi:hypothetical protein
MEAEKKDLIDGDDSAPPRESNNNRGLKKEKHKWVSSLEYILEYIIRNEK